MNTYVCPTCHQAVSTLGVAEWCSHLGTRKEAFKATQMVQSPTKPSCAAASAAPST